MITREAAGTLITHAGPEIGVASTKASTCQLTALFILAMYLGQTNHHLDESASTCLMQELMRVPGKLETVLSNDSIYDGLARELSHLRPTHCTWAAASTSPSPWKARSS